MAELIGNTQGYNDCEHLNELRRMHRVLSSTTQVKRGRGKKAVYVDVLKHNTNSDRVARDNLIYSKKFLKRDV
tara:strand:- start:116 stop:334 length:219 start_codon:yes stop_codon:yes gene_type:complete